MNKLNLTKQSGKVTRKEIKKGYW